MQPGQQQLAAILDITNCEVLYFVLNWSASNSTIAMGPIFTRSVFSPVTETMHAKGV
jgi:hypothetical protein